VSPEDVKRFGLMSLARLPFFAGRAARANAGSGGASFDDTASRTLRSIVQSIADALVVIDEAGYIRSFSPSAEKVFGYTSAEIVGKTVSVLIPPEHRKRHETAFREYVESGWASRKLERCFLTGEAHIVQPPRESVAARKDGSVFPVRLVVSEIEAGEERLFVALLSDLTERKRLEHELAHRHRQLQEAYAVIESQKQRMADELAVGREIQLSMLPRQFPVLEQLDLWAMIRPAREVGGDFYDVFKTGPSTLWLCIGDVSGKGVPAALLMAVTKTLIKSFASQGFSPGAVCTRVNAELAQDNDAAMFVSAYVVSLDLEAGELRATNAGHNPPLLLRANGGLERCAELHGPVLGALEDAVFGESRDTLGPGDTLLLFTDGVVEALDSGERQFSERRLRDVLGASPTASARELIAEIVAAVDIFTLGADQADDITLLTIRRDGSVVKPVERTLRIQVGSAIAELPAAIAEVERFVGHWSGDARMQTRFALAFDELLSNVIMYGFAGDCQRTIECELSYQDGAMVGTIVDDGRPFNPLLQPAPNMNGPLEERPIGGLGIPVVRGMFPEMRYRRLGERNVTTLREPMVAG
jgi:serine phosphatase RsbU (regulator of sigma subunit)/anti-sigma regulatory factor (Ser/Thr protein kinase)